MRHSIMAYRYYILAVLLAVVVCTLLFDSVMVATLRPFSRGDRPATGSAPSTVAPIETDDTWAYGALEAAQNASAAGRAVVLAVIGTRPEAIKMAPVVWALTAAAARGDAVHVAVCVTGQHADILEPFITQFGIDVSARLRVLVRGQSLARLNARALELIDTALEQLQPALVIVQGDTTTAMAATAAAFYRGIAVGHVEAGLRSYRLDAPFPEEYNRQAVALLACLHWAPTEQAQRNVLAEGVDGDTPRAGDTQRTHRNHRHTWVTGNTVVDALSWMRRQLDPPPAVNSTPASVGVGANVAGDVRQFFAAHGVLELLLQRNTSARVVYFTAHRRENQSGAGGMRAIFDVVARAARRYGSERVAFVFPVHPAPAVQAAARGAFERTANVHRLPPIDYAQSVFLLSRAHLALTDSGGLQEEAATLGVPAIVMRDVTERGEGVEAGVALLVGSNATRIELALDALLSSAPPSDGGGGDDDEIVGPGLYTRMRKHAHPYGVEGAGERIVATIVDNAAALLSGELCPRAGVRAHDTLPNLVAISDRHLRPHVGQPTLTIVMPVYNGMPYVRDALRTMFASDAQCDGAARYVIVDDGSTDGTRDVLAHLSTCAHADYDVDDRNERADRAASLDYDEAAFGAQHAVEQRAARAIFARHRCVVVTRKHNGGLPRALNVGMRYVTTPYVSWVSSDNLSSDDFACVFSDAAQAYPEATMLTAHHDDINAAGDVTARLHSAPLGSARHIWTSFPGVAAFAWSTDVMRMAGVFDPALFLAEDMEYWMRLLETAPVSMMVKQSLYQYRKHGATLTATKQTETGVALRRFAAAHVCGSHAQSCDEATPDALRRVPTRFTPERILPEVRFCVRPARCRALAYLQLAELLSATRAPFRAAVDKPPIVCRFIELAYEADRGALLDAAANHALCLLRAGDIDAAAAVIASTTSYVVHKHDEHDERGLRIAKIQAHFDRVRALVAAAATAITDATNATDASATAAAPTASAPSPAHVDNGAVETAAVAMAARNATTAPSPLLAAAEAAHIAFVYRAVADSTNGAGVVTELYRRGTVWRQVYFVAADVAVPPAPRFRRLRLAVIPSDPLAAYVAKGREHTLRGYYNPMGVFEAVYVLSPRESKELVDFHGMHVLPTKDAAAVRARIGELKIDVVRAYGGYWACDLAVASRVPRVPVVCSVHDTADAFCCHDSVKQADSVWTMSTAVAAKLLDFGVRRERLWAFTNRVSFEVFRPVARDDARVVQLRERYLSGGSGVDDDARRYLVVHVGRKAPQKNGETVARALGKLGKQYVGVFVGPGDAGAIQRAATETGAAVHMVSSVANTELAAWYAAADVMCNPSRWEGFGIVFAEALASGAAVVTTNRGPMNELVQHEYNGLLVDDPESADELARAIRRAAEDDKLRAHIRANARPSAERFRTELVDRQEVELYRIALHLGVDPPSWN
mmetsp:Transcript_49036/g.120159  ORF Transcript_49036/g.120159 Transcript_49036/m.120159 type:complete len:1444 (+) Transcript_49036:745-5076(+)